MVHRRGADTHLLRQAFAAEGAELQPFAGDEPFLEVTLWSDAPDAAVEAAREVVARTLGDAADARSSYIVLGTPGDVF